MSSPPAFKLRLVSATRAAEQAFWSAAALAHSVRRLNDPRIALEVAFQNAKPLAEIYNAAIDSAGEGDILVFLHDDLWIDDYFFAERILYFGPSPAACELLDGVLLAARAAVLRANSVRFDPAFHFHFYDMDFCRMATSRGLRLGTWPICVTHQSPGGFDSVAWESARDRYFRKWTD